MITYHHYIKLLLVALLPLLFHSCNPARKLNQGEYLLNKNHIIDKDTKIAKADIEPYIKQKPNRKIFVIFRFHLWLHNLVNEDRVKRKRILHNKRVEKRNARRVAKEKKEKKKDRQLFGEYLLNISEPPVVYDSLLAQKSAKQIKLFLNNKGYFISTVTDSVHYKRRKRSEVYYTIKAAAPYTINVLEYKIPDDLIKYYVFSDTSNTLIKKGINYDVDVLQQERERITYELNNNGYYLFTKDYIYYSIDTNIGNKKVNVTLGIKNFARKFSDYSDSIVESPHQRFYVNKVFIQPDFVSKKFDAVQKDTLVAGDYFILHTKKLRYKTRVLLSSIFIHKGELYQLKNVEDTYKRLSDLKAFKTINIFFVPGKGDYLDCYIQLSPILKQSFTTETEFKNTTDNYGIGGSIVYQNRNVFRGAEVLELRLKAGLESQKNISGKSASSIGDPTKQFNTVEIGPEGNVYIPRFLLPFKILKSSKRSNPRTVFTSSFIYQGRPEYYRYITNLAFSYTWKESGTKRHTITPFMINSVKVNLQPDFSAYLAESVHDLYIINSFSNHLSTSTRYTFSYNEQAITKRGSFSFFKSNIEFSGNILRGGYDLINSIHPNTFIKDNQGRYELFGVIYSQYIRSDIDYRYYYHINDINKLVFRIAAGIGKPFANFPQLPFERSFYSGGANGIRAWQSHTLGPGSYMDDGLFSYDQFGDGQLEGNVEYRFNIFKMLNGAIFIDAGNTWLRVPAINRPGGDFQFDRFYKEIAIGSGVGLRFDFNFFIIRFDLGLKLRDPQFAESKRWVINNLFNPEWKNNFEATHSNRKYGFWVFNIGIGYPF